MDISGALDGLVVFEVGESVSASYAARLLGDFGATLTKFEASSGDPLRYLVPLIEFEGASMGALFLALNARKQSVVLSFDEVADRRVFDRALHGADVLIVSRPIRRNGNLRAPLFDLCDSSRQVAVVTNLIQCLMTENLPSF